MPTVTTYPGVFGPYSPITFTRASTATYFDSTGTLTTAATNTPRLDYDPSTLAAQGFLVEESRTNSIRNNTMQGAVAGTPGTAPTNWVVSTATGNLTTREIVGTGTENGITYVDVRFVTSGAFTASIYADSSTGVAALNGQTWTSSFYIKLAGGSLTNLTMRLSIVENDSGGNFLAGADSAAFVPTSAALRTQRFAQTYTNTNASTAFEWGRIKFEFTGAGDVTLRIGLPQLEQGAFATSVIPTTTTALTRAADVASVNTLSPWYNASAGTLYGEITDAAITVSGVARRIATIGDAPNTDIIAVAYAGGTGVSTAFVTDNNVNQASFVSPSGAYAQPTKVALAYAANDFQASVNGSAFSAVTSGTVPTVTQMSLGDAIITAVGRNLNGHLRRVTYYPRRLSQAELIAITA
jgi:hypothetical protein